MAGWAAKQVVQILSPFTRRGGVWGGVLGMPVYLYVPTPPPPGSRLRCPRTRGPYTPDVTMVTDPGCELETVGSIRPWRLSLLSP